jgi:hypothetical protein
MNLKQKQLAICAVLLVLGIVGGAVWIVMRPAGPFSRSLYYAAEDFTKKSYDAYTTGSFDSATNALAEEIRHLERYRNRLAHLFHVDGRLKIAHSRLAYMLLHSGDVDGTVDHLSKARALHNRTETRLETPLSPEEFITSLMSGMERIDDRTGAEWKKNKFLDTNVYEVIRDRFLQQGAGAREDPVAL